MYRRKYPLTGILRITTIFSLGKNIIVSKRCFPVSCLGSPIALQYTHAPGEWIISCEISSSHGGEYDVQNCLLGCTAV
jgi:hypothetical protein